MSYYWIANREDRKFQRLNKLYAMKGQIGFLASERVDGRLILPEAVKKWYEIYNCWAYVTVKNPLYFLCRYKGLTFYLLS
jgi:hypothetical protein